MEMCLPLGKTISNFVPYSPQQVHIHIDWIQPNEISCNIIISFVVFSAPL